MLHTTAIRIKINVNHANFVLFTSLRSSEGPSEALADTKF